MMRSSLVKLQNSLTLLPTSHLLAAILRLRFAQPLVLIIACAFPIFGNLHAGNAEQLQQLRQKILQLESQANLLKVDRTDAYTQLTRTERKLGNKHREIRKLDRQQKKLKKELKKNRQARLKLRGGMETQKNSVSDHIRTAYLLGSQAQIKLLLNQERVDHVSRSLSYYRYLTSARLERIETMQTSLTTHKRLANRINQQENNLSKLRKQKLNEKSSIDDLANSRHQLLAKLDRRLQKSGSQIRELREDEQRLERLVNKIQEFSDPDLVPTAPTGRFIKQKKRLKLPLKGRILAQFGSRRKAGDQRWNGIFISAKTGQNVRSVYAGRVVFAGWLHGFGLLMILDHGEGYMTLYGHNRSLYKVVGDWVDTGDIVASSGDTGNPPRTGLYFGVRQQGKPRNPLIWCKVTR